VIWRTRYIVTKRTLRMILNLHATRGKDVTRLVERALVCIDAGHGGHDWGAAYNGRIEKHETLDIAHSLNTELASICDTILTREEDTFVPLAERARIANHVNADLFVSIHLNADPDKDGADDPVAHGEEIWIHTGSERGRKLAERIQMFVGLFASVNRGIKETSSLAVLRLTKMPAVLVEVGFIDDPEFTVGPQIAAALAFGIKEYLNA
jgi:N-acetylmuramoyl-L-alanine amidase